MFRCVLLAAILLTGCAARDREARGRDTRDGAGLPRQYPPGVVTSQPPQDGGFGRLRCTPEGQSTECTRDRS